MKIDLSLLAKIPPVYKNTHDIEIYRKLRAFGLEAAWKCDNIDENQYYERDFMLNTIKLRKVFKGMPSELVSTVYIPSGGDFLNFQCLWDTGGQQSCIDPEIAIGCGFEITGKAGVGSIHGASFVNVYRVPVYIFGTKNKSIDILMLGVKPISFVAHISLGLEVIAAGRFKVEKNGQLRIFTYELPNDVNIEYFDAK